MPNSQVPPPPPPPTTTTTVTTTTTATISNQVSIKRHIMISYNQSSRETCRKIYNGLVVRGHRIVDHRYSLSLLLRRTITKFGWI
jgi:predicted GNAT superfamily acetyltransferase